MVTYCHTFADAITKLVTNCALEAGLILFKLTAMVPTEDDDNHMDTTKGEEAAPEPMLKSLIRLTGISCWRYISPLVLVLVMHTELVNEGGAALDCCIVQSDVDVVTIHRSTQ